jgi:hypothetical protein
MPQRKPQRTGNQDPTKPLGEQTDLERERRKEQAGGPGNDAQPSGDGRGEGRVSQEGRRRAALQGRQPSPEPDVFMEVPRVQVDQIYLDDEGLDTHLSLQTRLADLVQLEAGVHVHCRKVELDATVVEAEALHKVRLENLYDILDRALAMIDHNPQILETLLKRTDAAVGDISQTAQQALGPGGAGAKAVDDTAEGLSGATKDGGAAPGQAAGEATEAAQGAGRDAGQQGDADRRRSREGEDKTKRGIRHSRSLDGEGGRGGDDQVRRAAWEATDQIGLVPDEAVQHVGRPSGEAVQQLRQATGGAVQRVSQPAVEGSAKATWTPRNAGGTQDTGQRRRPTPRRSREGKTKRGSSAAHSCGPRTATASSFGRYHCLPEL